jgi:hypothetical protein
MAVLAAAERQGISQPCQWRPPRTRPPAADQVMTLLLLQLVLGQLCGAEKSPQQLAHGVGAGYGLYMPSQRPGG